MLNYFIKTWRLSGLAREIKYLALMFQKIIIAFLLALPLSINAQLPNGSTAPDFTLTDYYGTEHNLYSYLDAGKTVILEVFAAHCPSCWNYHQTNTLKNLYNAYGPEGTNELMVLALEHDQWNDHNAFIGIGQPWVTQGNWLEGTPFPIFDVEDPDRGVFTDYNINGYPIIHKICPNRITERIFPSVTEAQVYEKVQSCQTLSVDDDSDFGKVYYNSSTRILNIEDFQKVNALHVMTITGQIVQRINVIDSPVISIKPLNAGIYLVYIQTEHSMVVRKIFLE
jgi:hypothetical protein